MGRGVECKREEEKGTKEEENNEAETRNHANGKIRKRGEAIGK